MADYAFFPEDDVVHNDFDHIVLDIMKSLQTHSTIYISGGCRSGKSTILCELFSRLKYHYSTILTSNNTKSIVAMKKFCTGYTTISRKVNKNVKYLLLDNVNMMTTAKFKYIMQMYPLAKLIVAGNPLYIPHNIDMSVISNKWKIFNIRSYFKLEPSNSTLAHPVIKLVKGTEQLEKYNKSRSPTTFRSIDTSYLMKKSGARLEIASNNTSDYLDMLVFTQQILIVGVGDSVLFKSTWMSNYNELGVVDEITRDCIKVRTIHGLQNVYRVEEEGKYEENIIVVRKQFPIVLANAVDITDMEGLYLGKNVKICRTDEWSSSDVDYAMNHSGNEIQIPDVDGVISTSMSTDLPRIQIDCIVENEGSIER